MSKCFEPWPFVSREERILDWLTSTPSTPVATPAVTPTVTPIASLKRKRAMPPTTPPSTTDEEHFAKRRRLSAGREEQHDDRQHKEEQRDELRDAAEQTTPRQSRQPAPQLLPFHQRHTPEPASPTRRSRTRSSKSAAIKTTVDLASLQVPVTLQGISTSKDAKEKLPADILPLYNSIRSVTHYQAFIPAEVQHSFEDAYGDDTPEHWFRASQGSAAAQLEAEAEFKVLRSLLVVAETSKRLRRYEDAWNAEVHLPLLKLAVSSHPDSIDSDTIYNLETETETARAPEVAAELITSATITADAIPRFSVLGKRNTGTGPWSEDGSLLACSLSQSGASSSNSGTSWSGLAGEPHSKKGSKKVDLALLLVPTPSSRLHEAITHARQLGSVNQSMYGPLRECPIACAIETKTTTATTDAVVQLGIWTVAWYRRMDTLWHTVHGPETASMARIPVVSLPLIAIVDHEWSMYYAVDRGDRIVSYWNLDRWRQLKLT